MDYVTDQLGSEADKPDYLKIAITSTTSFNKYPAKQHARRVAHKLGVSHGLIYLRGGEVVLLEDSDQAQPFRQRRYFYYLSGVDEPDCHLTYDIGQDELILYVPEITARKVVWTGRGSNVTEALERYDVDNAFYAPDLTKDVDKWIRKHNQSTMYILHPSQGVQPGDEREKHVDSTKLQGVMDLARVIKDAHEIELIKKANDISAKAHVKVLRAIKTLSNETEVEAIFLRECIREGAKHQAYNIIAASGKNAAVLHYGKNDESLEGRQLMCLDAGAEWNCYASDVTRTFPLSGTWPSRESRNIYLLVSKMQETCISKLKPGTRFIDLQILAHQIAIEGLLQLGILHNGTPKEILMAGTSAAFFPHGLGHHVGLEVHDVSAIPTSAVSWTDVKPVFDDPVSHLHLVHTEERLRESKWFDTNLLQPDAPALVEGMVVTVEPGIYFSKYALEESYFDHPVHSKFIDKDVVERYLPVGGVRIEDDILITKSSYKNLTTAPKAEVGFYSKDELFPPPRSEWRPISPRRHSSNELPPRQAFSELLLKMREANIDPLPEAKTQESLWTGFDVDVEEKPVARMNREKAQITIEETLRRLKKLKVQEERKDVEEERKTDDPSTLYEASLI